MSRSCCICGLLFPRRQLSLPFSLLSHFRLDSFPSHNIQHFSIASETFASCVRYYFICKQRCLVYTEDFNMRYQNWDVLVFPDLSKIPQQEFKTACQVIQDQGTYFITLPFTLLLTLKILTRLESHISQINPHLLPTVTSFIPGLPAGEAFRISIHSWENPDISRYALNLKKTSDIVMFEARVFIDGTLAG